MCWTGATARYTDSLSTPVTGFIPKDDCWLLNFAGDQQATHSVVYWRTGIKSAVSAKRHLCQYIGGRSSQPYSDNAGTGGAEAVLCYDGYLTPQNPANQHHCMVPVIIAAAKRRRTVMKISSKSPAVD